MNYIYLLKKLFNYNTYLKYREHIKIDKDSKEIYWLFKALDNIMEQVKKDITQEEYFLWVQVNLGADYEVYLKLIKGQDSNDDIIQETLKVLQERSIATKIAQCALSLSEGRSSKSDLLNLIEELTNEEKKKDSPFITDDIESIINDRNEHPGFNWRLASLNQRLGPIRRSHFGFIFARPETGKTTFLASEATFFAEQTTAKNPVLWLNNEEGGPAVKLRQIQAALGIKKEQLEQDPHYYNELYKESFHNKIALYDSANIDKRTILALVKDYNPSVIIIDQIDKIKGFSDDREDLRLGKIYIWARELAKEYAPVIGVCQADASAEGKKYLHMDNVANAKTAKQAEADWMLGIGKSHDPGFDMIRHYSLCKNKLTGNHAKWDVLIQPDIGRYKDI